jgi:transcriptional regulator of arginine metabolism
MVEKQERHNAITEIINSEKVDNQELILKRLLESGFNITQATLSRDLKVLAVFKKPDGTGSYIYSLPEDTSVPVNNDLFLAGYKSIEFSGNLGVVKTIPGYAASIASIIDSRNIEEILGTVAGDDTIMIVLKQGADYKLVENRILNK